ncbi:SDR family oxidoreductase [Micromonospora polyrhachis]|uniref:3-oxoacyl-[acyl-carrier protein] reductase n=1 Tax=Micromonospora polyrhachis TaxID=1282883 RepID=A0A7W7SN56_9ACTN|nr:SDR family oxidoreductase [Micromonospora polyrhachis]MBB4957849.1 3-oxoacyl-[acyl-carrier protein] reductase [Micromonospora polyrhachis]
MGQLDGKGAIVTGGSRGIGRAIVSRLVADGATVVFTYQQDETAAKQVAEESDGRAIPIRADLGVVSDVVSLFEAADAHLDGLDILVNNAGTAVPALIVDVTEADYDRIMAVNSKGVFLAIQQAGRRMRDGGRIVSISSSNTVLAGPGVAVYAASKAAVEQFTRVAAREFGGRGITVNSVSPGATDTDLLRGTNSAEGLRMAEEMTPLGRLGQPADVADVVAFLLGPDGRWMTGQNLVAAGGLI